MQIEANQSKAEQSKGKQKQSRTKEKQRKTVQSNTEQRKAMSSKVKKARQTDALQLMHKSNLACVPPFGLYSIRKFRYSCCHLMCLVWKCTSDAACLRFPVRSRGLPWALGSRGLPWAPPFGRPRGLPWALVGARGPPCSRGHPWAPVGTRGLPGAPRSIGLWWTS